jgi:hypothetical protein
MKIIGGRTRSGLMKRPIRNLIPSELPVGGSIERAITTTITPETSGTRHCANREGINLIPKNRITVRAERGMPIVA